MRGRCACGLIVFLLCAPALVGCGPVATITGGTWQQKCGWKAKDFFDDPQVIALCNAIEKNDVAEIDRLVAAGANVNAKGKGNMTPLLWAFFDNKPERFKRMLEHGADPNVVITEEFNVPGWFSKGESVTHLACGTEFPGYFEAVFEHGGNPSLVAVTRTESSDTPLLAVIRGSAQDKVGKVKTLIDKGAELDHIDGMGTTAATAATTWGCRFDIVQALLDGGADYRVYRPRGGQKLIHIVVLQERNLNKLSLEQISDYEKLVKWLEDHGESVETAKADIKRWDSWSRTSGEFRRKMDAEIAERKAREAKEAKKKKPDAKKPSE